MGSCRQTNNSRRGKIQIYEFISEFNISFNNFEERNLSLTSGERMYGT